MNINYICRHCNRQVGKLDRERVEISELGLECLNEDDHREMITYSNNGDMNIRTICHSCERTLDQHPHYHEQDYFIH
ncbi:anti-sigma-F factor Fin family protein [Halobacillus shinanisalinarum]|uniref:Anti-sigma-F factor Fin family protein n=1 Tax=Halobacillus shinanisalinarum TaxID=2932258 RepID=A0ABY4GX01_9BACI|nr:anti-sigma-F factor Fin [Halobacillus shinanisalinarum]UOQ91357.1 anti-sigma-F factor Fin family protein [Halobacillus shinanisalinarum]